MLPLLDDFLLSLQVNHYSDETLYNYERDLKVFEYFLIHDAQIRSFGDASKKTVELYKAYLMSRDRTTAEGGKNTTHLSPISINRHLSSLRRYLEYLIEMEYETPVLPQHVKLVKTPRHAPRVADLHELIKLIEAPLQFEKNALIAQRNHAMLEIIFSTGMRISELLSLTRVHIDGTGRIFIRGKGKKERFVYLTERAKGVLDAYLTMRRDADPALFLPYRGRNAPEGKKNISPAYLQAKIKYYRERLGINVPTSAHSLRHGFATYLVEQGANPAAVQILLGHESLDTTTRYVHASDRYAEAQHRKYHPLKEN